MYEDGKILTDLERIHELEEMVSALESENQKLKSQLQPTSVQYDEAGGEAGWVVEGLQQINQKLMKRISELESKLVAHSYDGCPDCGYLRPHGVLGDNSLCPCECHLKQATLE